MYHCWVNRCIKRVIVGKGTFMRNYLLRRFALVSLLAKDFLLTRTRYFINEICGAGYPYPSRDNCFKNSHSHYGLHPSNTIHLTQKFSFLRIIFSFLLFPTSHINKELKIHVWAPALHQLTINVCS